MNLIPIYPPRPTFEHICSSCETTVASSGNSFVDTDMPNSFICTQCVSMYYFGFSKTRDVLIDRDRRAIAAQSSAFGGD